jgi:hypothetical protein
VDSYRGYLTKYVLEVLEVAGGAELNKVWLAGFFFNSAIQRIAACYDRIPKLLDASGDSAPERMKKVNRGDYGDWHKVYREVNSLKHDPEGTWEGRHVSKEVAFRAMDQLILFLEDKKPDLVAKFPIARQ